VWLADARLRHESERACDDAVLNAGVDGTDYADHLVALARLLTDRRRGWHPAPAMARASSLQRRITAMLNARLNRSPLSTRARFAAAALLVAFTLAVAGLAAQTFATFTGTVTDQTGAVVPRVSVTLTHLPTNTKQTVQSDGTGAFELVGLRAGDYVLEAKAPGFTTRRDELTLSAGQTAAGSIVLQIGSLEETISVVHSDAPPTTAQIEAARRREARRTAEGARARGRAENMSSEPCPASAVGGRIRPPAKIVDVRPTYPATLRGTGTGGVVVLEARIGPGGTVPEVRVVSAPHADLADAAVDAVRQWEFTPTLLNCVPVDVNMTVTVGFRVE